MRGAQGQEEADNKVGLHAHGKFSPLGQPKDKADNEGQKDAHYGLDKGHGGHGCRSSKERTDVHPGSSGKHKCHQGPEDKAPRGAPLDQCVVVVTAVVFLLAAHENPADGCKRRHGKPQGQDERKGGYLRRRHLGEVVDVV